MLSSTSPIDRPSLHPGTRYLIAPRVPHGLASVVEGLTREVLRHRPEDIYIFAAHHFEKLLKLREQYYTEEYSGREFDHDFGCDFKLWPTKKAKDIGRSTNSDWSLEKEIEIFERRGKVSADVEESTDVSTDRENRKTSKQTCTRSLSTAKRSSKKSKDNETTSDIRATRIISQMSVLPGKNIQTKDIKQELRRNKLSGEKARATDNTEKGIRNERRSRMRISKTDKDPEEDIERTTTTTSSSRTSARRPLRKVRRIETESETETETISGETMAKTGHENRSSIKNNGANSETITRIENREKRPEAQFSEHSSKRKVSSRALSMDRIRAYVLRKFASSASLEVLRSPTYVEQVQEVIDRAAPIIKEKLEEVRGSRGKRSRSVDLAWNKEFFRQRSRDGKKCRDYEKEEESKGKTGNELSERKVDTKEETENHLEKDEMISNVETEEKKSRRRSGGSGKKARKRENGGDVGVVDQINDKHSDKLEYEFGATHDTLEAKLTATQNILEDISKSTYDLGGGRKNDSAGGELTESEISDHANVVSLPIVRPPSSRNSRSATKNGSDSLILPPISPEAPKSTKKKDELSLPVLPVATNGNHSRKSQDAEEASTMHDITNDIEDIAILPEDQEEVIVDTKEDLDTDLISSTVSDIFDAEKHEKDKDTDDVLLENIPEQFIEKCESLEEYEELERKKMEEIFKDSLNVTPEVVDMPPRPDSLEPDEEKKLQNDDVDLARVNTFDELKDKLIEIEMAERNIEMALAGQQLVMHDSGEETSQAEKSMIDGKINDVGKLADEMEETVSEIEKSTDAEKISTNKDDEEKKRNDEEGKNTNEIEKVKDVIEISMNEKENLLNITEKSEDEVKEEIERSSNEMKNTTNEAETSVNKIEKSSNKLNETEILTNEVEVTNQEEILTKAAEEVIKVSEDEKSTDENERSINEKSPTDVEKLTVKIQTEDAQSINLKSQNNDDQSQAAVCETDDDNVTASNNKADNTVNEFSKTVACESAANEREISATDLPDENTAKATKARKKREIDSCPTTSLSLELPFSYVLSEGSPCEIPDSVTTVIIPDRHYSSPATLEDENYQFESTNEKESFNTNSNIAEKSETQENKNGMEIFGEYIQPEVDILPDIDFVHNMRGVKSSQIIIAHQDLDKIKEEGEEEETKDVEKEEIETPREQKDDTQPIIHEEETKPVILEGIVEHEENEETSMKMTSESKDAEEISCKISKYDSSLDIVELMADTGLIDEENMNLVVESRDTMENSSEENGSTQDTHTITSSDVKESTVSNQSIESPSLDRPIVPELNLDSLQDNTVSSFKMTANGTVTKENNDSPRESDTTTSLIEPLISDERLMNQPTLADREEDIAAEELMESLRSEVPEADQLYQAEHAEYEWLEKDSSSLETNLEDEVKSQENSIGLKALPEDVVVVGPLLRDEEMEKEIDNEEEIARELIGSLEEDMQLYGKALEEKSKENEESEKSSLNMNDKPNQSLLESVDEQEKGEHEISSEEIQTLDKITRTETINELSSQMEDIKQDSEDKNIVLGDNETEELKLQVEEKDGIEITHVAPLAQFEQELLELNDTQIIKTDEEKITVENKLDTDTVSTDNQENLENSQTNIEEVVESQSNENINQIEELHEQEKNEEVQDREEYEPEKLEVEEKEEQEKLEIDEECQQEQSEKCTQEDLKIEETDNHENLQLEENIVDIKTIPLEATESRKGSINESTNNNDEGETEPIICDELIIDDETEKETKNNEIEKSEDLSAKIQNIHEPISEQSTKDYFHGGYWITETKSSTVETVIGTSISNEEMEPDANVPEIIQDESLIQKEDDFHSAVVKIQACLRGFLMRRRMKEDASSKSVSNNISSAQKIDIDDHLTVPHSSSSREVKTGRQRLRREEALRNTTLSLENAFATGRLQHTGEFHDSVPLALFDPIYRKDNLTTDEFLNKVIEEDAEQTNQSDIAKSNVDENNSVHDDKHGGSFQKGNIFTDHSTIPIVMHLLADASRNCHFTVSQNSRPDFNTNAGGAKPAEPTLADILMLGYPRDDENRYLNFITSVEDLGCNMDSLSLNNTIKCSKNTDDAHPSTTSGEGSIREPLALPGIPQGVVIEEVTSLETELVPSESASKPSITSKTSLDTNSSVPSEECTLEDEKNDLGTSPRIVDAMEDRKHIDGETEKQKSDCKHLEGISEDDSHSEDAKKESSEVSCDNHERVEEEKNEKT
ncbi:Sperm surface protein Sp17 [Camponotus floridanus]|uniref:Sperm surface protein Sp17 n=1 Tax=Camponotus floridanus TaxID=104421 RepID=E1ZXL2_CAMFO|nr:Sperm surface protein Sp17 [Camponotus floridanus]